MIDAMIESMVKDKLKNMSLTDKITGFLVKKKRRGTYQAMQESIVIEKEITDTVVQFIKEWMASETMDGFIKKELDLQLQSQVELELSSKGYNKVTI